VLRSMQNYFELMFVIGADTVRMNVFLIAIHVLNCFCTRNQITFKCSRQKDTIAPNNGETSDLFPESMPST